MVPEIFVISWNRFFLAKRDAADDQRFFYRRKTEGVFSGVEIEMKWFGVVTRIIVSQIKFPPERCLHLPGPDIVIPVVPPYLAAIGPDPLNNQLTGFKEGQFAVEPQLPLNTGPPAFDRVVLDLNLVKPGGVYIYFPLNKPFFTSFYRPPGTAGKILQNLYAMAGAAKVGHLDLNLPRRLGKPFILCLVCEIIISPAADSYGFQSFHQFGVGGIGSLRLQLHICAPREDKYGKENHHK